MHFFSIAVVSDSEEAVNFPTELGKTTPTNTIRMLSHKISLKIEVSIILLRNLNSLRSCNGTRLSVTPLTKNVIEAEHLPGCVIAHAEDAQVRTFTV